MADTPKINTAEVYRTVADLLPAEGRDFRINLATNKADGKQDLLVEGLTPMGKAWVPFLLERLRAQLKPSGVGVEGQAADLQTVNTVRKSVTEEFDAKLQARISDQEAEAKRGAEAAERLRKERNGGMPGAEESKALNAQRAAEAQVRHLKLVAVKVSQIRKTVEDRARKAAEKDKADGQDWSVDPDAPLETLFDRTNAEDRMRAKEDAVLRMAEHAAQMDELGGQAVRAAKYYALNK